MKKIAVITGDGVPAGAAGSSCCSGSQCSGGTPAEGAVRPLAGARDGAVVSTTSPQPSAAARTVIRVEGMDCASCAVTLERAIQRLDGAVRVTVNFAAGRLEVHHEHSLLRDRIERAVRGAGFAVAATGDAQAGSFLRTRQSVITGLAAMLAALGIAAPALGLPERAAAVLLALAIAVAGARVFAAALVALRARHMDMNVLMASAALGAAAIGEWGEAAAVMVLFSVGSTLQAYAFDRTRRSVRALGQLTPVEVELAGPERTRVPVDAVAVGDAYVVRPGTRIAVDGVIIEGATTVDESPVTGESAPREKLVDEAVLSGSLNGAGSIVVRATHDAAGSTAQQLARIVEQAQATRAPTEQFVDRFARVYTPIVVAAALSLMTVPALLGADASTWLYRGLALLIVACPCALVISTPATVVSAIGAASRRGILIKGGAALEAVGQMRAIAFDKTGTLTEGRPELSRIVPIAAADASEALLLAASLEQRSEHPLAHAILSAAEGMQLRPVEGFSSIPGRGAAGRIAGLLHVAGSPRLLRELDIPIDAARAALEEIEDAGETPVVLACSQGVIAVFGLVDAIRPDAYDVVPVLRGQGLDDIVMLTGDAESAARRVAGKLGVAHRSQLLPAQKLDAVHELERVHGRIGMVGDGINDAPALAAASVSFAMGAAGSDAALESADVALMQDDLRQLGTAVRISRAAGAVIRQNIVLSIGVKLAFVALAPFGLVTLWLAVLADTGMSVLVTLNGLRLMRMARRGG